MKNMYYSYDVTKVINVVLFIIHSFGNRVHLLLLNKLLYHADLMHLNRYGYLITKDKYVLMKNGLVPVHSYFLYTQLIESNSWITLKNDLREFFFIKGNFIYCFHTYNSDDLSNSEVSCLFETIRDYKMNGKRGFAETFIDSINNSVSLFNEISVLDLAKAIQVNDSMLHYISQNVKTGLYNDESKKYKYPQEGGKLALLSKMKIGSVIQDYQSQSVCIVVGVSFMKYVMVNVINDRAVLTDDFCDDMRRSFILFNDRYSFMIETAFINCAQLFTVSYDSIYQWMKYECGGIIGQINKVDVDAILAAIQNSSTITASSKEEFMVY